MTVFVGLLILAFLVGAPIYFVGFFFYYRKRPRPRILFWLVNPAVGVIWLAFILILVFGPWLKAHNAARSASAPATSPGSAGSADDSSSTNNVHLPGTWGSYSDHDDWLAASEADKEALVAVFAKASVNRHTAAFFYTNLNEAYNDKSNPNFDVFLLNMFIGLDKISPAQSYPTFLGYTWKRIKEEQTPQGKIKLICEFWPDGHSFLHYQKIQKDGTYVSMGAGNGPWEGDIAFYAATTTISGNNYTLQTTAPTATTESGTFQVSADGQELDMGIPGHAPGRYTKFGELVKSFDDIKFK
jgi:hypothetical protein